MSRGSTLGFEALPSVENANVARSFSANLSYFFI